MSNRIETIKNVIKNKVAQITHIRNVYGFDKAYTEGYPYAIVIPESFDGSFGDFSAISKRNIRNFNFIIRVYVERDEDGFGAEKAQRVIEETIDEIINTFDNYTTLGGEVLQVQVISGSFNTLNMGNTIISADVLLNCKDIVNAS